MTITVINNKIGVETRACVTTTYRYLDTEHVIFRLIADNYPAHQIRQQDQTLIHLFGRFLPDFIDQYCNHDCRNIPDYKEGHIIENRISGDHPGF